MKWNRKYHLNIETMSLTALKTAVISIVSVILGVVCIYITAINIKQWYLSLSVGVAFVISFTMKISLLEDERRLLALFVVDWALLLLLSIFLDQPMMVILDLAVLTSLYVCISSLIVKGVATVAFFSTYVLMATNLFRIFGKQTLSDLIAVFSVFWFSFFMVNLCVVYIEKLRTEKHNAKVSREREEQLQQAYRELENLTILKERNRIAKDIHDNVGHAITTVIMQTEAAKLSLEKDPEKAKTCILAANLQAVSALEQMRNSVHLLSDASSVFDLKQEMQKVVTETTTGTDIKVRAQIEGEVSSLPFPLALLFHNALKEGLNNGIRHGKATAFLFRMSVDEEGRVEFLLSDNGVGAEVFTEGFGLSSLAKQLKGHGYAPSYYTEEGGGFEMRISPVKKEKEE